MNTVLRYPGSKWRIADQLVSNIPEHKSSSGFFSITLYIKGIICRLRKEISMYTARNIKNHHNCLVLFQNLGSTSITGIKETRSSDFYKSGQFTNLKQKRQEEGVYL